MANSCSSLLALARACGAGSEIGGNEDLYMVTYNDLNPTGVGLDRFTTSIDGMVSTVGLDASKKFVKIDMIEQSTGLESVLTTDPLKGTFYTNTMSLTLDGLTVSNYTFINSVVGQYVAVLVKTRAGGWYAAGLDGSFKVNTLTGGTGIAAADGQKIVIGFQGVSKTMIPMVDPTLIPTLI